MKDFGMKDYHSGFGGMMCSHALALVRKSEGPKDSDEHERSSCWTESTPMKKYRLDRYGRERMYIDLQWLEEKGCTIYMYYTQE